MNLGKPVNKSIKEIVDGEIWHTVNTRVHKFANESKLLDTYKWDRIWVLVLDSVRESVEIICEI